MADLPTEQEARESILAALLVHAAGGTITIDPGSFTTIKRQFLTRTEDQRTGRITFTLEDRIETPWEKLTRLRQEHPDAKIVSDVGASMISGWGELKDVVWHEDHVTIEMVFD